MPAVDIAPLMDSPVWKSWDEPKRAEAKRLWQDKDTSDDDRAYMLQRMQQVRPTTAPQGTPPAGIEPVTEGGVERLLASRRADNPIIGLGSQGEQAQRPRGGAFTPDEPPVEETFTHPRNLVPLVAGGLMNVPATVAGVAADALSGESNTPANVGETIGTTLTPLGYKPIGGAIGAGAGEAYRQRAAGEPWDWAKIGKEAGWSAVPELLESTGRNVIRQFARNSPGGKMIRGEQAAVEGRGVPERVFQPRPADEISDAFEQVRRTQLPIDMQDMTRHLTTLSPGNQADALNLLTSLDRTHRTGGRYAQLYADLMQGRGGTRSIGDLQSLRSHLRQEVDRMDPGEGRNFVRNLQQAVDDTIDFGLTSGAMATSTPQIRDMLHGARRDWARRIAADDLGDMIEVKISSNANLGSQSLNLRGLADELRRGRSEISRSVNRALDMTPGARDAMDRELHDIARLYQDVELPFTDVQGISRYPGVAGARQLLGQALLTPLGRAAFRDAIIEGRGQLSPNALAVIANAVRREERPEMVHGKAGARRDDSESRRAPGGVARRTD